MGAVITVTVPFTREAWTYPQPSRSEARRLGRRLRAAGFLGHEDTVKGIRRRTFEREAGHG